METYSFLRELADSWVLLAMFGFFVGACVWAFLPSQSAAREDASMIPLRNDRDAVVSSTKPNTGSGAKDAPAGMNGTVEGQNHV